MKLNAYLTLNDGRAREAMDYYTELLGAEIENTMTFEEAPFDVPDGFKDKILHAQLNISGNDLMLSDTLPGHEAHMGSHIHLSLGFDQREKAQAFFEAVEKDGESTTPLEPVYWGGLFGAVRDKFGIHWMVSAP